MEVTGQAEGETEASIFPCTFFTLWTRRHASLVFPLEITAALSTQGRNVWMQAGMDHPERSREIHSNSREIPVPSCKLCPMNQGDSSVVGISSYLERCCVCKRGSETTILDNREGSCLVGTDHMPGTVPGSCVSLSYTITLWVGAS